MPTPTEQFFGNLFNEKDFTSLSAKTATSLTVAAGAWFGSLYFPTKTGELCNLKSGCLLLAVVAGGAAIYFGIKREKPARKKSVLTAIEDNDFVQKSGVITGLKAEETVQQLENCLRKSGSHEQN